MAAFGVEAWTIYWTAFVLLCLFLTILVFLAFSGLFATITVTAGRPPFSSISVAYKFCQGPYKNAGELFSEVTNLAPKQKCLGVYYDDPSLVAPQHLRYIVGCLLAEDGKKCGDDGAEQLLVQNGYKTATFPSTDHAVMTSFPFTNTISIFIAIFRVYPRLNSFIKTNSLCAHPCIELYEKEKIHFVLPLSKQDSFYVKEVAPNKDDMDDSVDESLDSSSTDSHATNTTASIQSQQNKVTGKPKLIEFSSPETLHEKTECAAAADLNNGDESSASSFEDIDISSANFT